MNDPEMMLVPLEARPYQGTAAGIATRLTANSIDALFVGVALLGAHVGVAAFRFVVAPRSYRMPDPSLLWFVVGFLALLTVYLTAAWWISGRTLGDRVMGIRVVTGTRSRLGLTRAFGRAVLCVAFPVGLAWCAVTQERRALHDIAVRTSVIYDWLPRPTRSAGSLAAGDTSARIATQTRA